MPFDDTRERARRDAHRARQGRMLAIIIAGTGIAWAVAQPILGSLGASPRTAILVDLIALAAFVWSMIVAWRIWRRQ